MKKKFKFDGWKYKEKYEKLKDLLFFEYIKSRSLYNEELAFERMKTYWVAYGKIYSEENKPFLEIVRDIEFNHAIWLIQNKILEKIEPPQQSLTKTTGYLG